MYPESFIENCANMYTALCKSKETTFKTFEAFLGYEWFHFSQILKSNHGWKESK